MQQSLLVRMYDRQPRLLLVLLLSAVFFSASFFRDFHSRGEPREALIAQNIFEQNNIILAEGYAGVVPSKPPLFHWSVAILSNLFGEVNEISSRLPSALSAIIVGLLLFSFYSKYTDRRLAFSSAILLSTSFEWIRAGSTSRVDMLLSCTLVIALTSIFSWQHNNYKGYPWLLFASLLAAILTKGPVGVVLPGFIFVVFSLLNKQSISKIFTRSAIVFIPALFVGGLWYLAAYLEKPDEFTHKVYYENVARFLSQQEDEPHKASIFKLYLTLVGGFAPWIFAVLIVGWQQRFQCMKYLKNLRANLLQLDQLNLYCLVVTLCTLLFYSIPESKRSVYLLPLYPFLSLFLARLLISEIAQNTLRQMKKILNGLTFIVLLLPAIAYALSTFKIEPIEDEIFLSIVDFYSTHSFLLIVLALVYLVIIATRFRQSAIMNKQYLFQATAVSVISLNLAIQLFIVPAVINPISTQRYLLKTNAYISEAKRVLSFGESFYALSFYANKRFYRVEESSLVQGDLIVICEKNITDFQKLGKKFEVVFSSNQSVMNYGKKIQLLRILG